MTGIAKALQLLIDNDVRGGRDLARLMWADSPCWQKVYNIGHGATKGVGMWLAGGSLLGKLRKERLIRFGLYRTRITLTDKGYERLKQEMPVCQKPQ